MGPKKGKKKKKETPMATIARMPANTPRYAIDPKICTSVRIHYSINCAKFFENRSRGLGARGLRKIAFPIDFVHRPYNSVGTTVPHCDNNDKNKSLIIIITSAVIVTDNNKSSPPLHKTES